MKIFLRPALESDIEKIKNYIEEFGLDDENLDNKQFYIAEIENKLAGFGRLKCYGDIYEIASLGIIQEFRGLGLGKKIIEKLINNAPSEKIWITTVIPEYFKQFGFVEDGNIPDEILLKCEKVCKKMNKTNENSSYMCYKKR